MADPASAHPGMGKSDNKSPWERREDQRERKAAAHKERLALRAGKTKSEGLAAAQQRQRARAAAERRPWEREREAEAKKQRLALQAEKIRAHEDEYDRSGDVNLLSDAALTHRLVSLGWIPESSGRKARELLLKRFEKRGPVSAAPESSNLFLLAGLTAGARSEGRVVPGANRAPPDARGGGEPGAA